MNAVFTIVAQNYLPLALTLGDSVKSNHPDLDFYILIADQVKGDLPVENSNHYIIKVEELELPFLFDLAFKYNVTEFCTALKPYVFTYLFEKFGFEKLIYFDPDIYVFNKLNVIYDSLDSNFIVLTPHFLTPELEYTGTVPEGGILFLGMFNLGFVAINNSQQGRYVVNWWEKRLFDKSYADRIDGYHTDQKWMDFIPVFFESGVCVLRKFGYNMAFWNIHERYLTISKDQIIQVCSRFDYQVKDKLVFFHFAGYDPHNLKYVHKNHPAFMMDDFPDLKPIMYRYKEELLKNGYDKLVKIPYSFAQYDNGEYINYFHRRLYRSLTENGIKFVNPFSNGTGSFYELLKKNSLLANKGNNLDKVNKKNYKGLDKKRKILNKGMRFLKSMLGFEKYAILLKFAFRYVRPENQTFLIKELEDQVGFIHEEFFSSQYVSKIKPVDAKPGH